MITAQKKKNLLYKFNKIKWLYLPTITIDNELSYNDFKI